MGYINKKKADKLHAGAHLNWMGGPSYDITNPLLQLRLAASSCFFGEPMYYQRDETDKRPVRHRPPSRLTEPDISYLRELLNGVDPQNWRDKTPAEMMESAIDAALDYDAEATLREAVRLRQEEHIRTTPQVILVRAAHHPKVRGIGLVRRYVPEIIKRLDEPAVGLAYQIARYGKPIPNALKKAWRDVLSQASEYALAKYRMEAREAKTVDVVNLVHFDQLKEADQLGEGVGGGTENGIWLFWDQAIRSREHWDMVFVYSDMQAGHGQLYGKSADAYRDYIWRGSKHYIDMPKLISTYRAQVNPNVLVFLVQVAGYQDTILPEFYDRTYILGGWGDGLLRFAAEMAGLNTAS
jgi:hypothetical protein